MDLPKLEKIIAEYERLRKLPDTDKEAELYDVTAHVFCLEMATMIRANIDRQLNDDVSDDIKVECINKINEKYQGASCFGEAVSCFMHYKFRGNFIYLDRGINGGMEYIISSRTRYHYVDTDWTDFDPTEFDEDNIRWCCMFESIIGNTWEAPDFPTNNRKLYLRFVENFKLTAEKIYNEYKSI